MQTTIEIKAEIHSLAEQLPDKATWDDVVREVNLRRLIHEGIDDAESGRLIKHEELKSRWERKLAIALDK